MQGLIDKIFREKAYGFITTDEGKSAFFHLSHLADGIEFNGLKSGQLVEFEPREGRKGLYADNVRLVPKGCDND